jgi:hypothetical protein
MELEKKIEELNLYYRKEKLDHSNLKLSSKENIEIVYDFYILKKDTNILLKSSKYKDKDGIICFFHKKIYFTICKNEDHKYCQYLNCTYCLEIKDYVGALKYAQLALKKGHYFILLKLATIYYQGYGVPKDINKSIEYYVWFLKSCKENLIDIPSDIVFNIVMKISDYDFSLKLNKQLKSFIDIQGIIDIILGYYFG